jgi:flagellar biosynthesis/type III secretory pathway protein FliH
MKRKKEYDDSQVQSRLGYIIENKLEEAREEARAEAQQEAREEEQEEAQEEAQEEMQEKYISGEDFVNMRDQIKKSIDNLTNIYEQMTKYNIQDNMELNSILSSTAQQDCHNANYILNRLLILFQRI